MSDSEDESRDKSLKIVIIGDGSSGKVSGLIIYSSNKKRSIKILFKKFRPQFQLDIPKINSIGNTIKH